MPTQTFYPNNITQTTGGKYRTFKNLSNIKNISNSSAVSNGLIYGKNSTPNRPSGITANKFNVSLPTGAIIQSITVDYYHQKQEYKKKTINIPSLTIGLTGLGDETPSSKKGAVPTGVMTKRSVTWSFSPSVAKVQSSSFGVNINYAANANTNSGYMRVKCICIKITYKVPSFSLDFPNAVKDVINLKEYSLSAKIFNNNLTEYIPSVTLSLPAGFTLTEYKTEGSLTKVNARTYIWQPTVSKKISEVSLGLKFDVDVIYGPGDESITGTFSLSESLTGASTSVTVTVTDEKKEDETPDEPEEDDVIRTLTGVVEWETTKYLHLNANIFPGRLVGDIYELTITIPAGEQDRVVRIAPSNDIDFSFDKLPVRIKGTTTTSSDYSEGYYEIEESDFDEDDTVIVEFPAMDVLKGTVYLTVSDLLNSRNAVIVVSLSPQISQLTIPTMSLLHITDTEELDRLGDGISYSVNNFLKVVNKNSVLEANAVPDWNRNFRVGVFNNRIEANCSSRIDYSYVETSGTFLVTFSEIEDLDPEYTYLHIKGEGIWFENEEDPIYEEGDYGPPLNDLTTAFTVHKLNGEVGDEFDVYVELRSHGLRVTGQDYKIFFNQEEEKVEEVIIDTTDYDNLTHEEIFKNAKYWSDYLPHTNKWVNTNTDFVYDANLPLILLFTQDFQEDAPQLFDFKYAAPFIVEKDRPISRTLNLLYPTPILNVIGPTDPAEAEIPKMEQTVPVILYGPNLPEGIGTSDERVISGISLSLELNSPFSGICYATLIKEGVQGQRSVIAKETDTQIIFGGKNDTWGFKHSELTNLDEVEIELCFLNNSSVDTYITTCNAQITLYTEPLENEEVTCKIEGEDLRYFGAFINDIDNPQGLKTKTEYLTIDGTDTNDSYSQTIEPKEITIELFLPDCNVLNKTEKIQQLANLITNDRDLLHRPIPKRLEFSHIPDHYYEYICEDEMENELDFSSATLKVKLKIPSGTAYAKEDTITGANGANPSLCAVKPIISLTASSNNLKITEVNSGQKFLISYNDLNNKNLVIDCENQTCTLIDALGQDTEQNEIDILPYCDINNDWFQLIGEYKFTVEGGVGLQVQFTERR